MDEVGVVERTATGEKYELSLMGDGVNLRALSDGRTYSVPTIQAQVVVAYLALERRRPVTRDHLADVLWSGQLPSTWAGSLRNVISRLRAFFADALGDDGSEVIASGHGGTYQFVLRDDVEIDVDIAEVAFEQARGWLASDDLVLAFDLASMAARLSDGDFLPAVADVEWVEARRRAAPSSPSRTATTPSARSMLRCW